MLLPPYSTADRWDPLRFSPLYLLQFVGAIDDYRAATFGCTAGAAALAAFFSL